MNLLLSPSHEEDVGDDHQLVGEMGAVFGKPMIEKKD
jgi:hypothetical protein